jgi:putative glutamine amidotransferase
MGSVKPIIGISSEYVPNTENPDRGDKLELSRLYVDAVREAGGVAVVIPPSTDIEAAARIIDGWLIPGGDDIDAKHFGQENHPKADVGDPARWEAESELYRRAHPHLPILGICYGCQFLNVARGGDLIQHLPERVGHENDRGNRMQSYRLEQGSKLFDIVGQEEVVGKSAHHQAVDRPGENLRVVAVNDDGIVEALEATDRPWTIGVQWHPERTPDDEATRRLFRDFIEAAAAFAEARGR